MFRALPSQMAAILARLRRPDPIVFMIVALLCAAGIVVFLQHRALAALDRQTAVILQKVAEQTLVEAAQEIRRTFDGPVFDTLAGVNHPLLVANRLGGSRPTRKSSGSTPGSASPSRVVGRTCCFWAAPPVEPGRRRGPTRGWRTGRVQPGPTGAPGTGRGRRRTMRGSASTAIPGSAS